MVADALYAVPDQSDLELWADTYGLSFPVLSDGLGATARQFDKDTSYPNYPLIAPGGEILVAGANALFDSQIRAALP
jgi:hypothetical protein